MRCLAVRFHPPLPEPYVPLSWHTALQFSQFIVRLSGRVSCMYCPMVIPTYRQGFAVHGNHDLHPERFFLPSLFLEVTQLSDMMDLYLIFASA